ncbi:MAG: apolipoprotein N-acyltransferase [candidate division WOR-3 bacterium]|nr:apolipoprotein N-acyltransferase [candidate division WOR-3 bacterium]
MVVALIVSALILNFAFAPFGVRFLAYFTLIPLLLLIYRYPYKKVFWYALIFGFAFAFFHLWWLYFLIVPVEPMTKILLYLGVTILFGYLGLYTAIFAVTTKFLGLLFAPLVWVILEFIRTKSEIGFPWGFLGYTQTSYIPIVQIASIFGVYGLSAWVIWINLIIFWILQRKHKLTYFVLLIISFIIPISYGLVRINTPKLKPQIKVAVIQPNVSPNEKGDYESRQRLLKELIDLVKQASVQKPDLIILPETATLVDITRNEELRNKLQTIVDSNKVYLFTGTPLYEPTSPVYYNGAVLFEPNKTDSIICIVPGDSLLKIRAPYFTKIYRKIHLVPFSERIPYVDRIKFLRKIETGDMGDCTPGKEYTIFQITNSKSQSPNRFGCLICFESIFPDLTREFTKRGAEMLINITNDGWFGKTPGPHQHCELAILRSVENGVPLVRCANNGISLITDPFARIVDKTKLFIQDILVADITSALKSTFYRKYGDIFIYIALIILFPAIILNLFRKSK